MKDLEINEFIKKEQKRQDEQVELIASENFVSNDVLEANGSILINKYAEGYPNKRYYGGCENMDLIEQLAIDRLNKMFGSKFSNVQPHSGTQANWAAYNSVLEPGDTILGMDLYSGGHLSHGFVVSSTSKYFNSISYKVNPKTFELDFEEIRMLAHKHKPKLIIAGASAYPRIINWKKFREIADDVGAVLIADIAHIAGLISTGLHPNPLDFGIDIVTSTTHKTLRGARGGIILTNNEELAIKIDKSIFPGTQGGPLMNHIAGKAVSFGEALKPEFVKYQKQVIRNAKLMADRFISFGAIVTTGGTDTHLFIIDVKKSLGITGQEAENLMHKINITLNKNTVPFDSETPFIASGIRIGTPAMTTKGWMEKHFLELADIIWNTLKNRDDKVIIRKNKELVEKLIKEAKNEKCNCN